jgi:purine nucleosidase
VEELIIMGGAVRAPGNVDSLSEFNFHSDPDAADYVLQSAAVPKVLVPLDVTHKVLLTTSDLAEIGDSLSGRLVRSIVGRYQKGYADSGLAGSPLHDPLAMGYCIDATFLELQPMLLRVETTGTYTRGACVPEERSWVNMKPNVRVAVGVDSRRFVEYFKRTASK